MTDPYAFLHDEPAPRMLREALRTLGTLETPGPGNSPTILGWWGELGASLRRVYGQNFYSKDSIPWCGLWLAIVAKRAGKPVPRLFLSAKQWAEWGDPVYAAKLGDVLVFSRDGGGHVGLYVGEDETAYHVLGGNQSDAVNVTRISKARLYAARNFYAIGQPANCRQIFLRPDGDLSENEA